MMHTGLNIEHLKIINDHFFNFQKIWQLLTQAHYNHGSKCVLHESVSVWNWIINLWPVTRSELLKDVYSEENTWAWTVISILIKASRLVQSICSPFHSFVLHYFCNMNLSLINIYTVHIMIKISKRQISTICRRKKPQNTNKQNKKTQQN